MTVCFWGESWWTAQEKAQGNEEVMGFLAHLPEIPQKLLAGISFQFDLLVLKRHIESSNRFGFLKKCCSGNCKKIVLSKHWFVKNNDHENQDCVSLLFQMQRKHKELNRALCTLGWPCSSICTGWRGCMVSMDVKLVKLFLQLETEPTHAPKCEPMKMNIFILLISGRSCLAEAEIKHHTLLPWFFTAFLFLDSINKLSSGCVPTVGIYIPVMMKLACVCIVSVFCLPFFCCQLHLQLCILLHWAIYYVSNCNAVRLNSLKHF